MEASVNFYSYPPEIGAFIAEWGISKKIDSSEEAKEQLNFFLTFRLVDKFWREVLDHHPGWAKFTVVYYSSSIIKGKAWEQFCDCAQKLNFRSLREDISQISKKSVDDKLQDVWALCEPRPKKTRLNSDIEKNAGIERFKILRKKAEEAVKSSADVTLSKIFILANQTEICKPYHRDDFIVGLLCLATSKLGQAPLKGFDIPNQSLLHLALEADCQPIIKMISNINIINENDQWIDLDLVWQDLLHGKTYNKETYERFATRLVDVEIYPDLEAMGSLISMCSEDFLISLVENPNIPIDGLHSSKLTLPEIAEKCNKTKLADKIRYLLKENL